MSHSPSHGWHFQGVLQDHLAHLQLLLYLCCFVHTFSSLTHFRFEVSKAFLSKSLPALSLCELELAVWHRGTQQSCTSAVGWVGLQCWSLPGIPIPQLCLGVTPCRSWSQPGYGLGCVWGTVLPLESFCCKFFSGLSLFMMLFQGSGCCCCFGNECHCLSSATGNAQRCDPFPLHYKGLKPFLLL